MAKLGFRIWLLGIIIIFSVISIIAGDSYLKLLVFLLLFGCLFVINAKSVKTGRILLAIVLVLLAGYIAFNSIESGVAVRNVDVNSSLFEAGLREGEIIQSINGIPIGNVQEYSEVMSGLFLTGEYERTDIQTDSQEYIVLLNGTPEIIVEDLGRTNIQTGLDLRGGARALVEPDQQINEDELEELIEVSRNRFNVFGLSDVDLRGVSDLQGNNFMLIEIAGATPDDLEELVGQQGKFEAKIGNETVFVGGEEDISDVCRNDASCAGLSSCSPQTGGYVCNFAFTVYLTADAAQRHADITADIPLDVEGRYLSERLDLFVDDQEVDSLLIGSSLRGQVTTQIQIQGSESGVTQEEAIENAREDMNRLQTVLITGSLPYSLEIVKLDTISPVLGDEFIRSILIAGIAAIVVTSIVVFIRYRRFKASLAMLFTAFSEIVIVLGIASLINWNLDLPSIAGILAAIGTSIDQQIVILDEARKKEELGIKERMKRALFVIVTAYATTFVALLPLGWAGAGLFRGFAFTTIIGITAGVLITRPAFAEIVRRLEE